MVGELPADFLRVTSSAEQRQIAADRQTAAYLQAGAAVPVFAPTSRLSITVAQVTSSMRHTSMRHSESFHFHWCIKVLIAIIESFNATELLWTVELAALLCQGGSETALVCLLTGIARFRLVDQVEHVQLRRQCRPLQAVKLNSVASLSKRRQ